MTTPPQKNDRLERNKIQWRRQKIHFQEGDHFTSKGKTGLRRLIFPNGQGLSSGEIEAIFRWEDDGGRTH